MSLIRHAIEHPDRYAAIVAGNPAGTDECITYGELEQRSRRLAHVFRDRGMGSGDVVAILMENRIDYFTVLWAAIRSGLYLTTINRHLTADEAYYVLGDCGARAFVVSGAFRELGAQIRDDLPRCREYFDIDGGGAGAEDLEAVLRQADDGPFEPSPRGDLMTYSSGTTGRPKGIKRPITGVDVADPPLLVTLAETMFGLSAGSVYLSPAPLYHSAPLGWALAAQYLGATVISQSRFDAEDSLRAIEQYRVTHSQWVPTMFSRMLRLPAEDRDRYDLSSMQVAIHAAAPCPVEVKRQMMEWWGPIVHEYYSGTEGSGFCYASPSDWLAHPGTVGRSLLGTVRICAEDGHEVPHGSDGLVYFEHPEMPFSYHGDPAKTRKAQHPDHPNWSTMGDVGHVDEEGFLYLTDRADFMIISGGVNIYPREIEETLLTHPAVSDAAVLGMPDDDMGERVVAIVELDEAPTGEAEFATILRDYCRERLAGYKVPREIGFIDVLPRLATGKLAKHKLRDEIIGAPRAVGLKAYSVRLILV